MNMKKFFAVLVLGLAVFAISCSNEDMFKMTVGGNTYTDSDGYKWTFSADGSSVSSSGVSASFVSASSATSATYSYQGTQSTCTINGTSISWK